MVEYNGTFWHPRNRETWKNPWVSFDDAMAAEEERLYLCSTRGFDLHIIWSDEDLEQRLTCVLDIIKEKLSAVS